MSVYSNKTVLVTGATGLIGGRIVDVFMKKGDVRVVALSRCDKKLRKGFLEYLENPNFEIIAQNISEPLTIEKPIHYIFHAAGPMEGKIIKNYPMDVINPNLVGTIKCLEFLKNQEKKSGIKGRMILFSSVTVYGNNTDQDITVGECDTRVTETLDAISAPYSQSKRMSEVITLAYIRQYGIDAVISRFSTVYGSTRFIPDTAFFEFIKKGIAGEDIIMNMSGLPRRDNIYVDDAVEGVLLVGSDGAVGEAYNISSNGDLDNYASVDEIAKVVADVANNKYEGNSVKVLFKTENTEEKKPGLKLSNEKLKKLGWNTTISLSAGIKKTMEDVAYR
ncbi:NAD-dependent epimerase/dehydratase family protein [Acetobacterium tundrae]|uniref:NAD-dependent epimerase/dehydratase family protein n=1 Tax=Acetobacterium tundrae TaxID=132932 RepID=A0ABR6WLB4_9FIRM|nr:NAD(P)-dependent oxidoreductase [Acetobacterium tundrae]MBC3797053.1 NAD-dependent epimerase/dehydratase family protein [Acetobacterium tundrae]